MFKTLSEKIRNAEFAADNGENWLFSKLQEVLKKKFLEESACKRNTEHGFSLIEERKIYNW